MSDILDFDRQFRDTAFLKKNPPKSKKSALRGGRRANNATAVLRAIKKEQAKND